MNKKNSIFTWIKRALIVILAIIFLVLAFYPAFAEESTTSKLISGELKTDGGTLIYTVTDNQASISSFSGELTDVVVPSSVDNYPIVAIEDYAFANSAMTSISLPDSVTTIGKGAFYLCESLKTVSLGKNVQSLGEYLFFVRILFHTGFTHICPRVFLLCLFFAERCDDAENHSIYR